MSDEDEQETERYEPIPRLANSIVGIPLTILCLGGGISGIVVAIAHAYTIISASYVNYLKENIVVQSQASCIEKEDEQDSDTFKCEHRDHYLVAEIRNGTTFRVCRCRGNDDQRRNKE